MNKYTEIYGIDINQDVFNVLSSKDGGNLFKNEEQGNKVF